MSQANNAREGLLAVVKHGGSTIGTDAAGADSTDETLAQIAKLHNAGMKVVVVHGGGNHITNLSKALGIPTSFVEGRRFTCQRTLSAAVMALAGGVNTELVAGLIRAGAVAIGVSGVDGRILQTTPAGERFGAVGNVAAVNTTPIELFLNAGMIPVIAPIGIGMAGELHNINADLAAAAIAVALRADHLLFLTDVPGVRAGGTVRQQLSIPQATELIASKEIEGGMIPKAEAAIEAAAAGIANVRIIGNGPLALSEGIAGRTGTALLREAGAMAEATQ